MTSVNSHRVYFKHFWILTAAALNIFVLYAPQPLLPIFAQLYGLSEASAGLLMTVTMLPLAIAPLSYGYLLSYVQPLQVLRFSLLLLAFMTCMTGLVQNFPQMLTVRFIHGLIIPASLTAVMSYLAFSGSRGGLQDLQKSMSLYVAATISGGFLGRLLAGVSSAVIDWRLFYFMLGAFLFSCFFMIRPAAGTNHPDAERLAAVPNIRSLRKVKSCLPVYLAIFCLFFVFCGALNYLPFRTVELSGRTSGLLTGFMYCGYLTGIATSMGAGAIIRRTGSESGVMIWGYAFFVILLTAMLLPTTGILFVLLFPFCGMMFLVHSVATAVVNRQAGEDRGLASGIYVSSYYGGGVLGTYLPGLVYENFGWEVMVVCLALSSLLGILLLIFFFANKAPGEEGKWREKINDCYQEIQGGHEDRRISPVSNLTRPPSGQRVLPDQISLRRHLISDLHHPRHRHICLQSPLHSLHPGRFQELLPPRHRVRTWVSWIQAEQIP
ncbi:MAG: MFS transporter [Desulfobulbaceae bacterium]|nr:MFS transporter [Desulfobulbaceae bacterium]